MDKDYLAHELLPGDDGAPVRPLADPVIAFIFRNEKVAGLAMQGLANAILQDSGDEQISEVIDITTQVLQPKVGERCFRLDVVAKTHSNEVVLLEVQLSNQHAINTRALLYAELPLEENIEMGDDWPEIAERIPRVIAVNLLGFDSRKSCQNFHQIAEFTYREEPREVAEGSLSMHNIQLPMFRRIQPDYTKPLHNWLTAICRAQDQAKTMREVVDMDENLRSFADNDPAFAQFVDQYQLANEDKQTRYRTRMWEKAAKMDAYEKMLEKRANIQLGITKGEARGEARGIVKGKAEGKAEAFLSQVLPLLLQLKKPEPEIYEIGIQNSVSREDTRKAANAILRQQRLAAQAAEDAEQDDEYERGDD